MNEMTKTFSVHSLRDDDGGSMKKSKLFGFGFCFQEKVHVQPAMIETVYTKYHIGDRC